LGKERRRFMGSLALRQVRRVDGSLVLTVSGIVDDATVECFEKGLDRATGTRSRGVIIDLTTCRLDSAGFAALVRLWRRSGNRAAGMRLVAPDADLFKMLQIIGLTSQFPTYQTMDAALPSPPSAPSPIPWARVAAALGFPRRTGPRRDVAIWPTRTPHLTSMDGAALPPRAVR
jgi:anti-anti-sigma factor